MPRNQISERDTHQNKCVWWFTWKLTQRSWQPSSSNTKRDVDICYLQEIVQKAANTRIYIFFLRDSNDSMQYRVGRTVAYNYDHVNGFSKKGFANTHFLK